MRGLIREDADKPCSGFNRAIETFFEIVGPEFLAHRFGQREDRQAFRNNLLRLGREPRLFLRILCDEPVQQPLGLLVRRGVEDGADVRRDLSLEARLRDLGLGVLLEMQLTSLPLHAREHGLARCGQSDMCVADDQLHAVDASLDEIAEDVPPVDLGLVERGVDCDDAPMPVFADTRNDEGRQIHGGTVDTHLLIGRVDEEDLDASEPAFAPFAELLVQRLRRVRDLLRRVMLDAHALEDRLDPPCRNSLYVHLRGGKGDRPLAP